MMQPVVVLPAQPADFEGLGIVLMVSMGVQVAADFAGLTTKVASRQCPLHGAVRALPNDL